MHSFRAEAGTPSSICLAVIVKIEPTPEFSRSRGFATRSYRILGGLCRRGCVLKMMVKLEDKLERYRICWPGRRRRPLWPGRPCPRRAGRFHRGSCRGLSYLMFLLLFITIAFGSVTVLPHTPTPWRALNRRAGWALAAQADSVEAPPRSAALKRRAADPSPGGRLRRGSYAEGAFNFLSYCAIRDSYVSLLVTEIQYSLRMVQHL